MVVVVGGPNTLIEATKKAAAVAAGAIVVSCELKDAATVAAKNRPFAMVVSKAVYDFDTAEFDALARDVNSVVIMLDTKDATKEQLQKQLLREIEEAYKKQDIG
jgi:hypothetical protein